MNIQIELSSYCNIHCVECPNRFMKRKRHLMSDEVFDVVLNKYLINLENREEELGYPPTVILHKDGESLINPRLVNYLSRISVARPEFRINLYTNGLLLTEKFLDFLETLPNRIWLFVSFHFFNYDGSKNNYDNIEKLFLKVLTGEKRKVEVVFTSHVTRFAPVSDLNVWGQIWKFRVPDDGRLTIGINNHINPWTGLIHEENCVTFESCPYADFGHLFIGATGNVVPCCMDLEEELNFGNVMEDTPEQVYSRLTYFYDFLRTHNKSEWNSLCQRCTG